MNNISRNFYLFSSFILVCSVFVNGQTFDHKGLVKKIHERSKASSRKDSQFNPSVFEKLVTEEVSKNVCHHHSDCIQKISGTRNQEIDLYLLDETDRGLRIDGILSRIETGLSSSGGQRSLQITSLIDTLINAIIQIIVLLITTPVIVVVSILNIIIGVLNAFVGAFRKEELDFINEFVDSVKSDLTNWSEVLDETDFDEDAIGDVIHNRRLLRSNEFNTLFSNKETGDERLDSMMSQLDSSVKDIVAMSTTNSDSPRLSEKQKVLENIVLYGCLGFVEGADITTAVTYSATAYGHQVYF